MMKTIGLHYLKFYRKSLTVAVRKFDTSSDINRKILDRNEKQSIKLLLNMFEKDNQKFKNTLDLPKKITLMQKLFKDEAIPSSMITVIEQEILSNYYVKVVQFYYLQKVLVKITQSKLFLSNVSGVSGNTLGECLVLFGMIGRKIPNEVLYNLKLKLGDISSADNLCKFLYFLSLSSEALKDSLEHDLASELISLIEESIPSLSPPFLYCGIVGCLASRCSPEILSKLLTISVQKESEFSHYVFAKILCIMNQDSNYPKFTDSAFKRRFSEFSAEDLLLLGSHGRISLVTPQELQEQLVKRLDTSQISINVLSAAVSFLHLHESTLISSLPEKIIRILSSPTLKYTKRELLSLLGCLDKYNKMDLYTSILTEMIPRLIYSKIKERQFFKLQECFWVFQYASQ